MSCRCTTAAVSAARASAVMVGPWWAQRLPRLPLGRLWRRAAAPCRRPLRRLLGPVHRPQGSLPGAVPRGPVVRRCRPRQPPRFRASPLGLRSLGPPAGPRFRNLCPDPRRGSHRRPRRRRRPHCRAHRPLRLLPGPRLPGLARRTRASPVGCRLRPPRNALPRLALPGVAQIAVAVVARRRGLRRPRPRVR